MITEKLKVMYLYMEQHVFGAHRIDFILVCGEDVLVVPENLYAFLKKKQPP